MDGREMSTTPKEMCVVERGSCSAVATSAAGIAAVPAALMPATSTAAVEKPVSVLAFIIQAVAYAELFFHALFYCKKITMNSKVKRHICTLT